MPRGDRTGPEGRGPLTGRRLGFCSNYQTPGFVQGGLFGRGRGFGPGRGAGRMNWYNQEFYPQPVNSEVTEAEYLESQMKILKNEISTIEKRLGEIQKKDQ